MNRILTLMLTLLAMAAMPLAAQAQSKTSKIYLKSGEVREIACSEIDSVTFATLDYEFLGQDYDFVPTTYSGAYYNTEEIGDFSLSFQNMPLGSDGSPAGAGQLLNLELITKSCSPMDISVLEGEYAIVDANERSAWSVGTFLSGTLTGMGAWRLPLGTYMRLFDDSGSATMHYGFATGGSVKCTVEGDQVTFDVAITTEGGHTVKMKYTGDASRIYDYSESYMPRQGSNAGTKSTLNRPADNRPAALTFSFAEK